MLGVTQSEGLPDEDKGLTSCDAHRTFARCVGEPARQTFQARRCAACRRRCSSVGEQSNQRRQLRDSAACSE